MESRLRFFLRSVAVVWALALMPSSGRLWAADVVDFQPPEFGPIAISERPSGNLSFGLIADNVVAASPEKEDSKVDVRLRRFINEAQMAIQTKGISRRQAAAMAPNGMRVQDNLSVNVYVYCVSWTPQQREELESLGFVITTEVTNPYIVVEGWLGMDSIPMVEALDFVRFITTPIPPATNTGSVTAESDGVMRSATVRQTTPYDGSGVKVGVISDGANNWYQSQLTGDLPSDSGLDIVYPGMGDEGTAMMEIVHDMAPGASLVFHGARSGAAMAAGIATLRNRGAKVIVDDLTAWDEPYFAEGAIGAAINDVTSSGVVYCTSAGNFAKGHYEQRFSGQSVTLGGSTEPWDMHYFGDNGVFGAAPFLLPILVGVGQSTDIILQWDDPWGTASSDYDLYLTNKSGSKILDKSDNRQNGSGLPMEVLSYTNTGVFDEYIYIGVRRYSGETRYLSIFVSRGEIDASRRSVVGSIGFNNKTRNALTVGAVPFNSTSYIEDFSSQGYVVTGTPVRNTIAKPDLVGVDRLSTTCPGTFGYDNTGKCGPFAGTSAAAPTVAAVAALVLQANPNLTSEQVRSILKRSALDRGSTGYDFTFGWGLCDAVSAIAAVPAAPLPVAFVNKSASGSVQDGRSWATAFRSVQSGLNAVDVGGQVWVASGQYYGNLRLPDGVALYGGFSGTESQLSQRNPGVNTTVLDGNSTGPVVTIASGFSQGTVLDGFVIRHGTATNQSYGGGVYVYQASPTISHNTFGANSGDIDCFGATATIASNTFAGNSGVQLRADNSELAVTGNSFTRLATTDSAMSITGGIAPNVLVTNNSFTNADSSFSGSFGQLEFIGNKGLGLPAKFTVRGAVARNSSWGPQTNCGFVIPYSSVGYAKLTIAEGATLTLAPGTVVQSTEGGSAIIVNGDLRSTGTAANPAILTHISDNSPYGGTDTANGNVWAGITYATGKTANLQGIVVRHARVGIEVDTANLQSCVFERNQAAVVSRAGGGVYRSCIFNGNGMAVQNNSTVDVDARQNDWGAPSGPYNADLNPQGKGNPVSNYVIFDPWNNVTLQIADAVRALKIAGGFGTADSNDLARLNVEVSGTSASRIDMADAVRILRRAVGSGL